MNLKLFYIVLGIATLVSCEKESDSLDNKSLVAIAISYGVFNTSLDECGAFRSSATNIETTFSTTETFTTFNPQKYYILKQNSSLTHQIAIDTLSDVCNVAIILGYCYPGSNPNVKLDCNLDSSINGRFGGRIAVAGKRNLLCTIQSNPGIGVISISRTTDPGVCQWTFNYKTI